MIFLQYNYRWYKRDDNIIPSIYVLLPISTHMPDFLSSEKTKKDNAKEQWKKESDVMFAAFQKAADRVLDRDGARKYRLSGNGLE